MADIRVSLNTGESYRVFAGQGNGLSEDGVTVILQAQHSKWEITFEFWTRDDAAVFFGHAARAAEEAGVIEAGDANSLMAEDTARPWRER